MAYDHNNPENQRIMNIGEQFICQGDLNDLPSISRKSMSHHKQLDIRMKHSTKIRLFKIKNIYDILIFKYRTQ